MKVIPCGCRKSSRWRDGYLPGCRAPSLRPQSPEAKLARLISSLRKIIDPAEDSVLFYILRTDAYLERRTLGVVKNEPTQFI